jgi:hypothetical protein
MGTNMHIENLWKWVRKTFAPSYQEQIDHYFQHCVDGADVERTLQTLQRRGML